MLGLIVLPCLTSVSPDYDYGRSTADNYARANARLRREFFASRIGLDYRWHVRYSPERQAVQDDIIRSMLSFEDMQRSVRSTSRSRWLRRARGARRLLRPQQPWCILTAGCMGAGKTHIMGRLDEHGVLPLPRFVRIDMDRIRALLPETAGYVARDKRLGGQMTQREAGTIAEILSEEALARGLNVWIDSSMQDVKWWTSELKRIKRSYPHKTCILYVSASWETVRTRAESRGQQTGRQIPLDILKDVYRRVPSTFHKLAPLVDEAIEIDNDGSQPHFKSPADVRSLIRVSKEVGGDFESRQLERWVPGIN